MDWIIKILLLPVFVWMTVFGVARRMMGRDPLQIRKPPPAESFWIARPPVRNVQSYFSEASAVEGRVAHYEGSNISTGRARSTLTARYLRILAGLFAPPKVADGRKVASAADRKQDIPDEIYTLW